jgi:hypothetical protein
MSLIYPQGSNQNGNIKVLGEQVQDKLPLKTEKSTRAKLNR